MWRLFRDHHYMSSQLNKSCHFYLIYWDDVLVGCISLLHQMSGTKKYIWRVHRIVILPDFQGLGIGTNVLQWMGDYLRKEGKCLSIRTSHFGMIRSLSQSPVWKNGIVSNTALTKYSKQHIERWPGSSNIHKSLRNKVCHTFMYKGPKYIYDPLYIVIDETNNTPEYKDRIEELILKYNDDHYIYITHSQIGKWVESKVGYELMKKYGLEHNFYKGLNGKIKKEVKPNMIIVSHEGFNG